MRKTVLLLLLLVLISSGCRRVQDFTNIKPLIDFIVLDNGNVEIVLVEGGKFRTTILKPDKFYSYDGESKVIETILDGYYQMFVYLSEEDYERFANEIKENEHDGE